MSEQEYGIEYSDDSFWQKVKRFALAAGKEVVERALILYYCLQDADTPKWAKGVVVGALGYFIVPLDAIPDFTPVAGYSDDLGALAAALAMVAAHIKPEHRAKAAAKLETWFG
ncbi:MAG: YkvA family protein [Candidatus Binatia bacterium]